MSKDSDKDKEWEQFKKYFDDCGIIANTYALNWDANNPTEMYKKQGKQALEDLIGSAFTSYNEARASKSKMAMASAGLKTLKQISNTMYQTKDIFLEAKRQAKYAGKLLGCALAMNFPFETHSINIIGFSLGCQVTKSCLKTLHQIGFNSENGVSIIQRVTLMGGAINFEGIGKEQKWRKIFSQTVAGNLRNVFSSKDYVLIGYSMSHQGKASGGRSKLQFEEEGECKVLCHPESQLMNFKNLDITNLAFVTNGKVQEFESGHLDYIGAVMYKTLQILAYY